MRVPHLVARRRLGSDGVEVEIGVGLQDRVADWDRVASWDRVRVGVGVGH